MKLTNHVPVELPMSGEADQNQLSGVPGKAVASIANGARLLSVMLASSLIFGKRQAIPVLVASVLARVKAGSWVNLLAVPVQVPPLNAEEFL